MSNRHSLSEDIELLPSSHTNQSLECFIDNQLEEESSKGSETQSSDHEAQTKPSVFQRRGAALFKGWKFTLFLAFISSLVVLFFNVGFLLYAATHPIQGDNRALYDGDCHKAKYLSTGMHVVINVLSTVLLSASNFGMVRGHFLSLLRY